MDNIQITKDCVQQIANIGSTTYVNICNGTSHIVHWGSLDWIGLIFCGLALVWFITVMINLYN